MDHGLTHTIPPLGHQAQAAVLKSPQASSLYTILPHAVQSRIPVLASFRRTASSTVFSRPSLRRKSSVATNLSKDEIQSLSTISIPGTPRSGSPETTDLVTMQNTAEMQQPENGADWDLAAHAAQTLMLARNAAQQPNMDPARARAMHIDAVRFMAMSLPQDLSVDEITLLQRGMPQQLFQQPPGFQIEKAQPNSLRQGMAHVVCWLMALTFFFIPLLLTCLNKCMVYEREHQITQRLLTGGFNATGVLSERGVGAVVLFRDSLVGKVVVDVGIYVAEGVGGGIIDGYRNARAVQGQQRRL